MIALPPASAGIGASTIGVGLSDSIPRAAAIDFLRCSSETPQGGENHLHDIRGASVSSASLRRILAASTGPTARQTQQERARRAVVSNNVASDSVFAVIDWRLFPM